MRLWEYFGEEQRARAPTAASQGFSQPLTDVKNLLKTKMCAPTQGLESSSHRPAQPFPHTTPTYRSPLAPKSLFRSDRDRHCISFGVPSKPSGSQCPPHNAADWQPLSRLPLAENATVAHIASFHGRLLRVRYSGLIVCDPAADAVFPGE